MAVMATAPASTRRSLGGRLWRVALYLAAFLAVMGSMAFLGRGSLWANLTTHAVAVVLVVALSYGARRYVDHRPWREIGVEAVRTWQSRPADEVYPILFVDGIGIKVRDSGTVTNKVAHLVVGIDVDGFTHVLGIWVQAAEVPSSGWACLPSSATAASRTPSSSAATGYWQRAWHQFVPFLQGHDPFPATNLDLLGVGMHLDPSADHDRVDRPGRKDVSR